MTTCRCGVDVKWVALAGSDERVPIEAHTTLYTGPDRYRIVGFEDNWTVEPIDAAEQAVGYVDHRTRCPR